MPRLESVATAVCIVVSSTLLAKDNSTAGGTATAQVVRVQDMHRDGKLHLVDQLGIPVGILIELEGRRAPAYKHTNACTFKIEKIDGKAFEPQERYDPFVQVANVDELPEDVTLRVEGYEFLEWSGDPMRNWGVSALFVITKVHSPVPAPFTVHQLSIVPSQGVLDVDRQKRRLAANKYFERYLRGNAENLIGEALTAHPDIELLALHRLNEQQIASMGSLPTLVQPRRLPLESSDPERGVEASPGDLFEFQPKPGDQLYLYTEEGVLGGWEHSHSPGLGVYVRGGAIWAVVEFGLDAVP